MEGEGLQGDKKLGEDSGKPGDGNQKNTGWKWYRNTSYKIGREIPERLPEGKLKEDSGTSKEHEAAAFIRESVEAARKEQQGQYTALTGEKIDSKRERGEDSKPASKQPEQPSEPQAGYLK